MTTKEKIINSTLDGFKENHGRASVCCFSKNTVLELVYSVVDKCSNKRPWLSVLVVVDSFGMRKDILAHFEKRNEETGNNYQIKCLSANYIVDHPFNCSYVLTVIVGVHDNLDLICKLRQESKFTLSIFTENAMSSEFITGVQKILPLIESKDLSNAERRDDIYSDVQEFLYAIDLTKDDRKEYDKCNDYIATSVSIFGDFDAIEKCKKGDPVNNLSAAQYREMLAGKNGWSKELNRKTGFMKQIDDVYNPNILFERACTFFTIVKKRRDLVMGNEMKLLDICNICAGNPDKRILIVSKSSEFAAKVTRHLNNNFIKCGDYHDCIDESIATDDDGMPVYYKSGKKAGKPKVIGAQAQSTLNKDKFNKGLLKALSIKYAANPGLDITCDIVILTSPFCNINEFKQRYKNICFNSNPTIVHTLYCNNTIESDEVYKHHEIPNITIMQGEQPKEVMYDERSGSVIL